MCQTCQVIKAVHEQTVLLPPPLHDAIQAPALCLYRLDLIPHLRVAQQAGSDKGIQRHADRHSCITSAGISCMHVIGRRHQLQT